ncbi:exosortase/archaeosortase family protein [Bythopirellula goksoeyrii]|uniref:Transmembrane exosortase (Exosortase_EpsH) n=1 Tax=Bythopirellula goksoeyrii TaxID=1400387 RepID=A0A5B9QA36_9BACT|nr:exosortase/archaeosortase family protein [Bythopirellula goksoeyrii]QEG33756.1 Transmembrane exosortase (Exosortase_EpsH) [Bythopirellula goksoeyrii]
MASPTHAFSSFESEDHSDHLSHSQEQAAWICFGVLVLLLTLGYFNMLEFTAHSWSDGLYSHGYIIPVFAAGLFWFRRKRLTAVPSIERWIGVAIVLGCLLVRLYASYLDMNPLDRLSYIGALLGVCLIVGGYDMLKWAGPPVAFLVFMFPLPSKLENTVLLKLQTLAAMWSTWTLQLLGIPALREGSHIIIEKLPLEVADACSGLRMGTIFGAMSVALAMVIDRPWWDRLTILVFAIPVALATNVIRITLTALLYLAFPDNDAIHHYIHNWAGLAMMPIALGFLWIELTLLSKLTVPIESDDYASFGAAHG